MQQSGPDFLFPVFDYCKPFSKINRCVAPLATFFVDANVDSARLTEPVELAEELVAVHRGNIGRIRPTGITRGAGLSLPSWRCRCSLPNARRATSENRSGSIRSSSPPAT